MRWTAGLVAEALGQSWTGEDRAFTSVSTDTRTLEKGALYVALRGEQFDGHAFLSEADRAGAAAAVVEQGQARATGLTCFEVSDTRAALRQLAGARRRALAHGTAVVAVTGTNGKTTTKDMIAGVLATRLRVHATEGNRNNQVGVPLTILATPDDAEAVVAEVAMNLPGEIARLTAVVQPDIAVITNVGPGHLEGLGSVERVLEEKLAILAGARLAVVGTDPPGLAARARELAPAVVVAGLEEPAVVRPEEWSIGSDGRVTLTVGGASVTLGAAGAHQAANAMLAVAVGEALGVKREVAGPALQAVPVASGRTEFRELGGFAILNDSYNANPASVRAALEAFAPIRRGRRSVVVVGTMLELGRSSADWHETVAREIAATDPDVIAAVGEFVPAFQALGPGLRSTLLLARDVDTLGRDLAALLQGTEAILLKASRGVALERVLNHLAP
jgi:UDP-N-acetylmuramoyl-tripeptide--D-alanyl-D-alanine ligase